VTLKASDIIAIRVDRLAKIKFAIDRNSPTEHVFSELNNWLGAFGTDFKVTLKTTKQLITFVGDNGAPFYVKRTYLEGNEFIWVGLHQGVRGSIYCMRRVVNGQHDAMVEILEKDLNDFEGFDEWLEIMQLAFVGQQATFASSPTEDDYTKQVFDSYSHFGSW
jgi:hypothetical protein